NSVIRNKSGRRDSNPRPPGPKPGALTKLRYFPFHHLHTFASSLERRRPKGIMAYDWIIEALEDTWSSTEHTLQGRSERDFDALTSCPGWNVRDIVNHLTGTELFLNGASIPDVTEPSPPYVKNSLGKDNEAFVASRRHLGVADVLADFHEATGATLSRLRALSSAEWGKGG